MLDKSTSFDEIDGTLKYPEGLFTKSLGIGGLRSATRLIHAALALGLLLRLNVWTTLTKRLLHSSSFLGSSPLGSVA